MSVRLLFSDRFLRHSTLLMTTVSSILIISSHSGNVFTAAKSDYEKCRSNRISNLKSNWQLTIPNEEGQ